MSLFARRTAGKQVLVAIGLLLGAAGTALATGQVFVTNGELSGCAHRENGKLRLASAEDPCKQEEEAVAWNVKGPPGPPGPAGPRGEKGEPGANSLDALAGTPCTIRGSAGTTALASASVGFRVEIYCLAPDEHEPNDSRETARPLSGSFTVFALPSIFPAGDHDWFAVNGVRAEAWLVVPALAPIDVELYKDGSLVASGTARRLTPFSFNNPTADVPADWLLHVSGDRLTEYSVFMAVGFPRPPTPPTP